MLTILFISSGDEFGYVLLAIVSFVVGILITRWVFKIDTMVHYAKIQANLLIKIAKYNKVPIEEIYEALERKVPKDVSKKTELDIAAK